MSGRNAFLMIFMIRLRGGEVGYRQQSWVCPSSESECGYLEGPSRMIKMAKARVRLSTLPCWTI